MLLPAAGMAEESLYSPAYGLSAGAWLWQPGLQYEDTHYRFNAQIPPPLPLEISNAGDSRFLTMLQGFQYGLTDQWSVAVQGRYAFRMKQNENNPGELKNGIRSPRLIAQWRGELDPRWVLTANAGFQYNPEINSGLNSYFAGSRLTYRWDTNQTLSLNWLETQFRDIDSRLSTLEAQLTWPMGVYLGSVTLATAKLAGGDFEGITLNDLPMSLSGTRDARRYSAVTIGVSRPIAENVWLGIDYYRETFTTDYRIEPGNGVADDNSRLQELRITARVLF
ncbi:hypothetical protein SAMN05216526_0156 [Ectothiorhodosinus mongolicus]|uniref:Uncharacterized protein n=1 Tax=Ectothiorhodosinus mongolicus TaxID=233100 RepID=A0A1R3VMD9_9GAMM|nr:hypothetical protein [Ectothiorhodosinus mongolicus]ULX57834.1 hypothetical protein CKX93_09355 [Ectothiorhodosinus mongolicus]SIT65706.1 hypothetical protein SAMN05216526_0156 [Ectothiorhodosinus mongolicus]